MNRNLVTSDYIVFIVYFVIVASYGIKDGFTFIQQYTGFISPGVLAMFVLGMFRKRTTGAAAVAGLITGFVLCVYFNIYAPQTLGHETWLYTAFPTQIEQGGAMVTVWQIPFLICMGLALLFAVLVMVAFNLAGPKVNPKAFMLDKEMFKVKPSTMALIIVTLAILMALYVKFW